MHIKNQFLKILYKLFVTIIIIECAYLFAVPLVTNEVLKTDVVKNFVSSKTNAKLDYQTLKIKTYLVPNLSIYAKNVELLSKETDETFAQTQNLSLKIKLLPMISKKLDFKKISTQKMLINIEKDEEGIYNFTKLFPKNNKTSFKLII